MNILNVGTLENCIDGDFVYLFTLDSPWTKERILALNVLGRLKYYESFPKPMFQLCCNDGTIIKAVQGTSECRVIYNRNFTNEQKKLFEEHFAKCLKDI